MNSTLVHKKFLDSKNYWWLRLFLARRVSANYGHERIQITRHGKPVAFLIGVVDFARLEELEDAVDRAEYRAAKADDDGRRVSLTELQAEV